MVAAHKAIPAQPGRVRLVVPVVVVVQEIVRLVEQEHRIRVTLVGHRQVVVLLLMTLVEAAGEQARVVEAVVAIQPETVVLAIQKVQQFMIGKPVAVQLHSPLSLR